MNFYFHQFRFHLEPEAPLRMPAHNKGNVIRGGLEARFACLRATHRQGGSCAWELARTCS